MIKAICEYCGKEFVKKIKKSRCCSQDCYQLLYRKEHQTIYKKVCTICGKEFEATKSTVKYCSSVCSCKSNSIKAGKYAKKVSHEPRACAECGGEFIPKTKTQRFCSNECSRIYTAKNYKQNFLPKICPICGKEFIPNSTGAKYCSAECRNEGKKKAAEKKASECRSTEPGRKIKKSDYPDVPSSKRWEKMSLAERNAESRKYHLTYGQAQGRAYCGTLPETFGEVKKIENTESN